MLSNETIQEILSNPNLLKSLIKEGMPMEYKILEALETVRLYGYGTLTVKVIEGKPIIIEQTVSQKLT